MSILFANCLEQIHYTQLNKITAALKKPKQIRLNKVFEGAVPVRDLI